MAGFWEFVSALFIHWGGYVTGGVVTAILVVLQTLDILHISKRIWAILIFGVFFFFASFSAWQDARKIPRPKMAGIRLIQEPILSSPYQDAPYGIKIVMQTDVVIQPFKFKIKCNVPLRWGDLDILLKLSASQSYHTSLNNSYTFQYNLDDIPFIPEIPVSIRLWSSEAITDCHRIIE
jgi:hypothetical protein